MMAYATLVDRLAQATAEATRRTRPAPDAGSQDCWGWLCAHVHTIDEASKAIRPWPRDKAYLRDLITLFQTEPLLAIPKSRRMLVSWVVAAYLTWQARFHGHQLLIVQSETEEKAAYLVAERCKFIEEHLPGAQRVPVLSWRTKKGLTGKLHYPQTGSQILSVAQGAHAVRSYTFSTLVMDEVEFQDEGPQAVTAALPAVEKGAQVILISSANGPQGVLARLCKDVGFVRYA